MTVTQIAGRLDSHIEKAMPGNKGYQILIPLEQWNHVKYICTTDEKRFSFFKGKLYYRGYELVA